MNRFLGACGATGPIRLAAERPRVFGPVSVTIDKPFALIGSGVHADLRLDDNQVSHRHLYLQVYNGRVFAIDLGSRTGTHWENDQQPFGWLDLGKSIWVGRHRVYLEGDVPRNTSVPELPQVPLVSRDFKPPNLVPVSLEFVKGGIRRNGGLEPARCGVNRVMVLLGRADGCKIRLLDSSVSKYHCSLIRTPRGVWVVDLLSRNGIWVNGAKVPWARLEQGDRLEVGAFVLRLHYGESEHGPGDSNEGPGPSADPADSPAPMTAFDPNDLGVHQPVPGNGPGHPEEGTVQAYLESNYPNSDPNRTISLKGVSPFDPHHAMVISPRRSMIPIELSESIAVIIANQFSQMQQQMFDQFHQVMMVMFQTFGTLHKDQMEIVRRELNRVHDLTQQLHALQAELAKQPAAKKDPEVERLLKESEKVTIAPVIDPAQAFNPEGWNEAVRGAAPKIMAKGEFQDEGERENKVEPNVPDSNSAAPIFATSPGPSAMALNQGAAASESARQPTAENGLQPISAIGSSESTSNPSVPPVAADIHAKLCQKIAAIQAERQTRWQKIMGFLAGKPTGEAVP